MTGLVCKVRNDVRKVPPRRVVNLTLTSHLLRNTAGIFVYKASEIINRITSQSFWYTDSENKEFQIVKPAL